MKTSFDAGEPHGSLESDQEHSRKGALQEFRDEFDDQLEKSLYILPSEDDLYVQIRDAQRSGDLKRSVARANLLALRSEIAYSRSILANNDFESDGLSGLIHIMLSTLDENFQGDAFSILRSTLEGAESRLAHLKQVRRTTS
jgi:hypothetical protein